MDTDKVLIAFWLSSGFYSATKALSTPLPWIMIFVLLEPAFPFFVPMSGRPLAVTTFLVFSRPLCSHFAVQIVIREFSAPLQQHCLSLSRGFPLHPKFAMLQPALLQLFCSTSWSHSAVLQQRCSFCTGMIGILVYHECCICCCHQNLWNWRIEGKFIGFEHSTKLTTT